MPSFAESFGLTRRSLTPAVRALLVSLLGVYLVSVLIAEFGSSSLQALTFGNLALYIDQVFGSLKLWQLVTYAWLHDIAPRPVMGVVVCVAALWLISVLYKTPFAQREPGVFWAIAVLILMVTSNLREFGGPMHVVMNALGLWFFGPRFEQRWGTRWFVVFWFCCAAGGAVLAVVGGWIVPSLSATVVVGASGAVFGLLAALAVWHPNDVVLTWFMFPVKARHLVLITLAADLLLQLTGQSAVSFLTHAGGALTGYLLASGYWRPGKLLRAAQGGPKKPSRPSHLRLVKRDDPPRYLH